MVLGVSTDKLDAQEKFIKKEKLTFPLIADPDRKVTSAYGALGKLGYAKRVTFVIDKTGVVRKVYTEVAPAKHPQEVLDFVRENLAKAK